MNIRRLWQGLSYRGEVDGKRQRYYVFEGKEFYLVLSFSKQKRGAGNFNIVESEAVEYIHNRFAGARAVTSKDVVVKARRTRHVPTPLAALNALYVLAATGRARIDTRRTDRRLFFNVRTRDA